MASALDVLIPARLIVRALDDLHTLAEASQRGLETLERLEQRAARIESLGTAMEDLGRQLSVQARVMDEHAERVAALGEEIVSALPTLTQAITIVTPLEGTVERIGRVVDRLPDRRRRTATSEEAIEPGEEV